MNDDDDGLKEGRMQLRSGTRLRSQVSEVAVVIVMARRDATLECGGLPLVPIDAEVVLAGQQPSEGTTLLGKRYVNDDATIELMCTKAGPGVLSCDGHPMMVKDSKALPSSD